MAERDLNTPQEKYKIAQDAMHQEVDNADPFIFQVFSSVSNTAVLPENRKVMDWSTEIVPAFKKARTFSSKLSVPVMVPARFEMGTTRNADNILAYTMLCLDIDNSDVDAKGNPRNPLHPLGFSTIATDKLKIECLIYTTWSNREKVYDGAHVGRKLLDPGHPKFRVLIPLKRQVHVDLLRDAKPFLMKLFPYADPHSFVPSQPSNLPSVAVGNEHNFFSLRVRGPLFDLHDYKADIYLEKGMIETKRANTTIYKKQNATFGDDGLDSANLYLSRTDPDLPHLEWLAIGFCLRAIYAPRGQDEEAFQLFYEWSRPGKTFNDNNGLMKRNWDNYWIEDAVYTSFGFLVNQSKRFPI